jgi:ABC-type maltose transport system permease subunit
MKKIFSYILILIGLYLIYKSGGAFVGKTLLGLILFYIGAWLSGGLAWDSHGDGGDCE